MKCRTAKATGTKYRLSDSNGLYLQVSKSGTKSWLYKYTFKGVRREMGLGPYPDISLKEARERCLKFRRTVLDGLDPIEVRKEEQRLSDQKQQLRLTFGEAARRYFDEKKRHEIKPVTAKKWLQLLEKHSSPIWDLPCADIQTVHIHNALSPEWTQKAATLKKERGKMESVLGYAAMLEGRQLPVNPAQWKGNLDSLLTSPSKLIKNEHQESMRWEDVPEFYRWLVENDGIPARVLRLQILTSTRPVEARELEYKEFDATGRVWHLPSERSKTGASYDIPLNDQIHSIFESHHSLSERYAFTIQGGKPVSETSVRKLILRYRESVDCPHFTAHGFRSSFRSWCEANGVPYEVGECCLNHSKGSHEVRAYARHTYFDERRKTQQRWAQFVTSAL